MKSRATTEIQGFHFTLDTRAVDSRIRTVPRPVTANGSFPRPRLPGSNAKWIALVRWIRKQNRREASARGRRLYFGFVSAGLCITPVKKYGRVTRALNTSFSSAYHS